MTGQCVSPLYLDPGKVVERVCVEYPWFNFDFLLEGVMDILVVVKAKIFGWKQHTKSHEKLAKRLAGAYLNILHEAGVCVFAATDIFNGA